MRQIVVASLVLAGALPLGAQERTLDARFSRTAYAEPTFYVNRAAYVAVFEIVGGDRVVQRYPRVEAQAATALPAGETTLAWLDVNLGRIADAPGTRTVFYRDGIGTPSIGLARAPIARTMLLVASTHRLRVGATVDFLARYRAAIDRQPAGRDDQDRALAAVAEVVHPEDPAAEVVTYVETMWLVSYPEFQSAAVSRYTNESYGYGSPCDAIAPWGYAAYATWTDTSGCPDAYAGYFPGQSFYLLPRFPFGHGSFPSRPHDGGPTGVVPGTPVGPAGSPGVHRARPLTTKTLPAEQMPVQTHGGIVFAGPVVDHPPIARREAVPTVSLPANPGSVSPATPPLPRGEPGHPDANRYQPVMRGWEPVRPERNEPSGRAGEPSRPASQPTAASAPARPPAAAPAATPPTHTAAPAAPAAPTAAPATHRPAPSSGAQQVPKRN